MRTGRPVPTRGRLENPVSRLGNPVRLTEISIRLTENPVSRPASSPRLAAVMACRVAIPVAAAWLKV